MIVDYLPTYYDTFGDDAKYEIIRSMLIDGHEVAWMSYSGTVQYDLLQQGNEGKPFVDYRLYCECDFIKGVGWSVTDTGAHRALGGERKCLPRKAAQYLRQLELRREYEQRFDIRDNKPSLKGLGSHFSEIVLDLIEKGKAHEWLEDGAGAWFWGGFFYAGTVGKILELDMEYLFPKFVEMVKNHQITMEGHVIRAYTPAPVPEWSDEPSVQFEVGGWVAKAFMPKHSRMPQQMRYQLLDPEGKEIVSTLSKEPLLHNPGFGLDVEDMARIDSDLKDFFRISHPSK